MQVMMKKAKIKPREREGDWASPEFAEDTIYTAVQELNDLINFMASMGYSVTVNSETINAGEGWFFSQLDGLSFYDKDNPPWEAAV